IQSVAWIGMSITGIVGYHCTIKFDGVTSNFGSLLGITLFQMYFRGDCTPSGFPTVSFTAIDGLSLMTPLGVHAWMWAYLSLSLVWLFSSFTLLTNVKKANIRFVNVFLYIWIALTLIITMMDLALFILFTLDYDTVLKHSLTVSLNFAAITQAVLITAQNASGMMMSIALRGYILWIINFCLAVYLFIQTFKISDHNRMKKGFNNAGFMNTEPYPMNTPPISAYDMKQAGPPTHDQHPWYNYLTNDNIPRINRQTLVRSNSLTGVDQNVRRTGNPNQFGNTSGNEEVILRREQVTRELKDRQSMNGSVLPNHTNTTVPPTQTVNLQSFDSRPQLRSAMRNSRYN
ncbi:unnamed protein product, partial [Diamesa hyperborea]